MTKSILAAVVLAIGAGCAGYAIDYEVNRRPPPPVKECPPMLDQRVLAPALHSTPKGHPYHHREPGDRSAERLNREQLR